MSMSLVSTSISSGETIKVKSMYLITHGTFVYKVPQYKNHCQHQNQCKNHCQHQNQCKNHCQHDNQPLMLGGCIKSPSAFASSGSQYHE